MECNVCFRLLCVNNKQILKTKLKKHSSPWKALAWQLLNTNLNTSLKCMILNFSFVFITVLVEIVINKIHNQHNTLWYQLCASSYTDYIVLL